MKRKTVTALLMGLCLTVSVPGTAYGAAEPVVGVTEKSDSIAEQSVNEIEKEAEDKETSEKENKTDVKEQTDEKEQSETASKNEKQEEKATQSVGNTDSDMTEISSKVLETQSANAGDIDKIEKAVQAADAEKQIDLSSEVMKAFLEASNLYDGLNDTDKASVSKDTVSKLTAVRDRIAEAIHTDGQVTVGNLPWYVQVKAVDSTQTATVCQLAADLYEGSTPQAAYAKDIQLTDIRSGSTFKPDDLYSLTFPIPENYNQLVSPKVFRLSKGKLTQLQPETRDGKFYVGSVYPLENIFIIDTPAEMTGITMDSEVSVNVGQSLTLQVSPVPAAATSAFSLEWKSADPSVISVDASGKVTALREGQTTVTATVTGTSWTASCTVKAVQGAHALSTSVATVLKETKEYMLKTDKNPTVGSEWFALGLARSGLALDNTYFKTYYNHKVNYLTENNGKLTNTVKYTEYSKAIITLTALGKDARDIAGYNLFEPLADFETVTAQGTNGPIWALIALNCNPAYSIPEVSGVKVQTTEQRLVDYLLSKETSKGGWTLAGNNPDSDLTGMALQALAPYYHVKGYEKVTAAIDRALEVLSTMQNQSGGYSTMGVETSESCAQVLTALCALGIDPMKDERFVKGGSWIVENLLSYRIPGSGFMHVKAGAANNGGGAAGGVDGIATEQAYYALTAYQRLLDGKTALYDMSDINLNKGEQGDGKGTGLEEQDKDGGNGSGNTSKDNTTGKDDKKDTNKTNKKKTVSKKKLTYKGKKLTLASSGKSGSKGSGTSSGATAADGSAGESSSGWLFDPEDADISGTALALKDSKNADKNAETGSLLAETTGDAAKTADASGDTAKAIQTGEATSQPVLPFLGGMAIGVAAAVGGVWLYFKKKRRN